MALCPKCKKEIEYLDYCAITHTTGVLQIDDGLPLYDEDWHPLHEAEFTFECPECRAELFNNEREASDFIKDSSAACPSGQA